VDAGEKKKTEREQAGETGERKKKGKLYTTSVETERMKDKEIFV
jgi:hypothetical protein